VNQDQYTGRADIHMHSTSSDGFATVHQILGYVARKQLLDVIAITDHDVMDSSLWAYNHRHNYPFDIIPGVEVSSADGHVLALWVTNPIEPGMSLKDTTTAIHKQGGVAILAHPFEAIVCPSAAWSYLRNPQIIVEAGIDAIEIHNAGAFTPGNNLLARRLANQLGLPTVGNSDGHSIQAIGRGTTSFKGQTADDLRHAILTGDTVVDGRMWPAKDYVRLFPNLVRSKLEILGLRPTPQRVRV
jgi:predicted metal-dependent phosphoesterase TrpH